MQTLLKVTSIIYIVFAGLGIIAGIILSITLASLGTYADYNTYATDMPPSASIFVALGAVLGIIVIIASVITLITGIFGLKGASGNKGLLTAGIVLVIISLVFSLASTFYSIANGEFSIGVIVTYALPVLYLVSGINVRKEL